jgi:hypothetical protein
MKRYTKYSCGKAVIKDRILLPEAMEKLAKYEDTGLSPSEFVNKWIPVEERCPEDDNYILLSFENFTIPAIGRYEEDEYGGTFYLGDDDDDCKSVGLYVNAWMPLPNPYRKEQE